MSKCVANRVKGYLSTAGKTLLAVMIAAASQANTGEACTTMIVTRGAALNGRAMVSHSNDSYASDPSIVFVPAADHPDGSRREVYPSAIAGDDYPAFNAVSVPRLVTKDRGEGYRYHNFPATKPLGSIPQVRHTYGYLDSDYGIVNEKGLMLGECTNNSAHLEYTDPVEGGNLFYASELGRVALERCATAKEAVALIGALIDEYGIWGTGETLLVADKNEGWVLEMNPVPDGKGVWIAQRVPDGEFFVAANQFRIRDIDPKNKEQYFNRQLTAELKRLGWAVTNKETGLVDWVASMEAKEDFHPYFSLRRVWRAEMLVNPGLKLPDRVKDYKTRAYPFSVKPAKPLSVQDIMAVHRDYYGGTPFDTAKQKNSGLMGSPYRYDCFDTNERPINYSKSLYTWILQDGGDLAAPVCWLALNTPRESVFVPLPVAELPEGYDHISKEKYERKPWWITSRVADLTKGYFSTLSPWVREEAARLENNSVRLVEESKGFSRDKFYQRLRENSEVNCKVWEELFGKLVVKLGAGEGVKYAFPEALETEKTAIKY